MKKRNLVIILSVLLIALIALFGTLHITSKSGNENNTDKSPSQSQNNDSQNEKEEQGTNITVKLVLDDKSEKVFEIKTTATTLADALLQERLISQEEYDDGFYSTINGVRADYNLDKTWWCFYINGKEALTGANEITLNEGDSFEIVQTPA